MVGWFVCVFVLFVCMYVCLFVFFFFVFVSLCVHVMVCFSGVMVILEWFNGNLWNIGAR